MSKKPNGPGKGPQKQKSGQTTETDYKVKYTDCSKELKTAKADISSLETNLKRCRFDLFSLQKNFNYEEVRGLLPSSMDNDGLQADQNARLMAVISDLRQQLEKQNGSKNQIGSSSTNKESVDDSDSTIYRNKIPTLEREKAALEKEKSALEREKSALERVNGSLDNEVKEYKIKLDSKVNDERNEMERAIEDLKKQLQLLEDDLKAKTRQEPRQKSELILKQDEHVQALTIQVNKISELEKDKLKLEIQLNKSQDDFKRLKSEKESHVCKKDKSNESSNDKIRFDLEADKKQLQVKLKKSQDECDRLKKEIEVYTSTEEDYDLGVDQIKEKERESKDMINNLRKEIVDIQQANKDEKEKDQRSLDDLKVSLNSTNNEVDSLKEKLKEEQERFKVQTKQNIGTAREVENELREEIKELKMKTKNMNVLEDKTNVMEGEIASLRQDLETAQKTTERLKAQAQRQHGNSRENELIEEIEKLKSRLSQMAGAQLMTNNPNIADLSDANRPTKIAEQYTELYDNEWTNVYEILDEAGNSEFTIIDTLYGLLVDSFRYCIEKSVEQTKQLKISLTSVQKQGDVISDDEIVSTKLRQLRELRKAFAPDIIDSIFQSYKKDKKPKHIDRSEMKYFVHKCITLCWFMAVQDPPVVIDTNKHTGTFNGDLFKTYTTSGKKIDFIVWPPLYLHDGGPMLSKGIAQGK